MDDGGATGDYVDHTDALEDYAWKMKKQYDGTWSGCEESG